MDPTQRYCFGQKFENAFLRLRGKEFENFFARVMAHAFPSDFKPVRPYGRRGDLKCDGFRSSDGTVFQCYAPRQMKLPSLLSKIEEDLAGALDHWKHRMRRWEFVHNEPDGLPGDAIQKLEDLERFNPDVQIAVLGESELRAIVMALQVHQLEDLFGAVPSQRTIDGLDFAALRQILVAIQRQEPATEPPLDPPSVLKLEVNALSEDAAGLLRQGRRREKLVEQVLNEWPDPRLGEEIAEGFRSRYRSLKSSGLAADSVFRDLQNFAGGMDGEPVHQAAVLAVLSYFFERCDIFEDTDSRTSP